MEKYIQLFFIVIAFTSLGWLFLRWMPGKSIEEKIWPRLYGWLVLAVVLFAGLFIISPQQAEVVYYKFSLVVGGAFLGFVIDRVIFPYSRPDGYLKKFWQRKSPNHETEGFADHEVVAGYEHVFAQAMIRRALIIVAVSVSVTLGM